MDPDQAEKLLPSPPRSGVNLQLRSRAPGVPADASLAQSNQDSGLAPTTTEVDALQHPVIPSSPPLPSFYDAPSPTSSEPPIFSSDAPFGDEDVSNYQTPRPKRKREGTWWERNGDDKTPTQPTKHLRRIAPNSSPALKRPLNDFHKYLKRELDCNSTTYSREYSSLEDHDLEHLTLLNQLIDTRHDPGTQLPAEGQYRPMVPSIYLELTGNRLRHLHHSLFQVEHLTYLCLRNNDIEELPPMIGQMVNLQTLDISLNRLKHLPYELKPLIYPEGHLNNLVLLGNPLLYPLEPSMLKEIIVDIFQPGRFDVPGYVDAYMDDLALGVKTDNHHEFEWGSFTHVFPKGKSDPVYILLTAYLQRYLQVKETHLLVFTYILLPFQIHTNSNNRLVASMPPTYYEQNGTLLPDSPPFPESSEDVELSAFGFPNSSGDIFQTPIEKGVLPLSLLALHYAIADSPPSTIREYLQAEFPFAERILKRAEENKQKYHAYFLECANEACGKQFVVPRAEWLEFWCDEYGELLPLKRSACSWYCAERAHGV